MPPLLPDEALKSDANWQCLQCILSSFRPVTTLLKIFLRIIRSAPGSFIRLFMSFRSQVWLCCYVSTYYAGMKSTLPYYRITIPSLAVIQNEIRTQHNNDIETSVQQVPALVFKSSINFCREFEIIKILLNFQVCHYSMDWIKIQVPVLHADHKKWVSSEQEQCRCALMVEL